MRTSRFPAWLNAQARLSGRVGGQGSGIETLTGVRWVETHHQRARTAGRTCTFACNQLCCDVHRSRLWIRDSPCSGLLRHNGRATWTQLPDRTCRPIYRTSHALSALSSNCSSIFPHRFTASTLHPIFSPLELSRYFPDNNLVDFFQTRPTTYYDIMTVAAPFQTSRQPWHPTRHRNRLGSCDADFHGLSLKLLLLLIARFPSLIIRREREGWN